LTAGLSSEKFSQKQSWSRDGWQANVSQKHRLRRRFRHTYSLSCRRNIQDVVADHPWQVMMNYLQSAPMLAGTRDFRLMATPWDTSHFEQLSGCCGNRGLNISYAVQTEKRNHASIKKRTPQ
jgi:hypothetical protein